MREQQGISDDLYNKSIHGYFATAKFRERARMVFGSPEAALGCDQKLEDRLGCSLEDFTNFLKKIADDDGIAYVPIGGMECVALDVFGSISPDEASKLRQEKREREASGAPAHSVGDVALEDLKIIEREASGAPAHSGPPKDDQAVIVTAQNSHLIALDNLSHISPEQSDDLYQITRDLGFAVRALHADNDENIFDGARDLHVLHALRGDIRDNDENIFDGARDGRIYIDLADSKWRAVEIKPNGRELLDAHDLPFVRPLAVQENKCKRVNASRKTKRERRRSWAAKK